MQKRMNHRWAILLAVLLGTGIATGCQTTCDEYTTDFNESAGVPASSGTLAYQSGDPCRPSSGYERRER